MKVKVRDSDWLQGADHMDTRESITRPASEKQGKHLEQASAWSRAESRMHNSNSK